MTIEYSEEWIESLIENFLFNNSNTNQNDNDLPINKTRKFIIRNSDLIIANENKIQMLNLSEFKSNSQLNFKVCVLYISL